jgi:hypothetical protein
MTADLSESSRIKPFLDLSGRSHRKQGFDPPRLQFVGNKALAVLDSEN